MCDRRKLKANAGNSKVMIQYMERMSMIRLIFWSHSIKKTVVFNCKVRTNEEVLEKVVKFRYLVAESKRLGLTGI